MCCVGNTNLYASVHNKLPCKLLCHFNNTSYITKINNKSESKYSLPPLEIYFWHSSLFISWLFSEQMIFMKKKLGWLKLKKYIWKSCFYRLKPECDLKSTQKKLMNGPKSTLHPINCGMERQCSLQLGKGVRCKIHRWFIFQALYSIRLLTVHCSLHKCTLHIVSRKSEVVGRYRVRRVDFHGIMDAGTQGEENQYGVLNRDL